MKRGETHLFRQPGFALWVGSSGAADLIGRPRARSVRYAPMVLRADVRPLTLK